LKNSHPFEKNVRKPQGGFFGLTLYLFYRVGQIKCKMWRSAARYEFYSVSKRRSDIVTSFIHFFCAEQFSVV